MKTSTHPRTAPARRTPPAAQEEKRYGKVYDPHVMRRLWPFVVPYTGSMLLSTACMLGSAACSLMAPYLVKLSLDDTISRGDLQGLSRMVWIYIGIAVLGWFMQYGEWLVLTRAAQRVLFDLRRTLFQHLMRLDLAFYDRQAVGRLMSRVQNDVGTLQDLFTSGLLSIIGDMLTLLGILLVMLSMHPKLTLLTCAVVPLMLVLTFYWRTHSRRAFSGVRSALARVNAALQENISSVRVIQSLCSEVVNLRRFDVLNQAHFGAAMYTARLTAFFFPIIEVLSVLGIALVVVGGGPMVLDGQISAGSLVAFVLYMHRFFEPLRDLSFRWNSLQMAMASGERLFDVLDAEVQIVEDPHPVHLSHLRGEVTFDRVSFHYQPGVPVLQDISLHVAAGQRIALVGHTGAGKTTFINLLARFYDPTAGTVSLDGIDVRRLSLEHLRAQIGIVLQEPFLFSGSVRDNLRYANPEASDATVVAAARTLGIHDSIMKLAHGYDTDVRERGGVLSQGQRQLISFVRALLADPRILILDEATASIDAETEQLLQAGLATLLHGRTAFIIAHRLSTVKHADRILVLDQGRVVENGTHDELLRQEGLYARLYTMTYAGLVGQEDEPRA